MSQSRKITFRGAFSSAGVKDGRLNNISLITGGVEALGHGVFVDEKSLDQVAQLCIGKPLPAYLTHDGLWKGDRLTQEIGLFSGICRDGDRVIASQFDFLAAFKKHEPRVCETLLELAAKIPDQFGLSIVFSGYAAWVKKDGSEVADFEAPMPPDAVRSIPSIRVQSIESADFVKNPAANPDGLAAFMAKLTGNQPQNTMSTVTFTEAERDLAVSTAVAAALEKKSSEYKEALDALNAQHASELSAKDEALKVALEKAALEKDEALKALGEKHAKEVAEINEKLAKAESLSASNIGVQPPVKFTPQGSAEKPAPMTDSEWWSAYAELCEKDKAAAEKMFSDRYKK